MSGSPESVCIGRERFMTTGCRGWALMRQIRKHRIIVTGSHNGAQERQASHPNPRMLKELGHETAPSVLENRECSDSLKVLHTMWPKTCQKSEAIGKESGYSYRSSLVQVWELARLSASRKTNSSSTQHRKLSFAFRISLIFYIFDIKNIITFSSLFHFLIPIIYAPLFSLKSTATFSWIVEYMYNYMHRYINTSAQPIWCYIYAYDLRADYLKEKLHAWSLINISV